MTLNILLIIISSIVTASAVVPYIANITKGKTKPRIISWIIWSVMALIIGVAALSEGQYATAILSLASSISSILVVIFSLENGDRQIGHFDIVCLFGAIIGITLWAVFNSPAIAVVAIIVASLMGGIPTMIHSWKKPGEETEATYVLYLVGAICTLLAVVDWRITAFAYPVYLVVVNIVFVLIIFFRKRTQISKKR